MTNNENKKTDRRTHLFLVFAIACFIICARPKDRIVVAFQPSHQTETGKDFDEARTCNAIVEAAIQSSSGQLELHKVWSFNASGLHHAREGSNTRVAQTSALVDGKISGYAYELAESNKLKPDVFVSVHNNGGTKRHACWGFVHEGDPYEWMNRELAKALVDAICQVTGLENRGVYGDSTPGRNDYRCVSTGKRAFYSLDEHVNQTPLRVLLEIGDNQESREFLADSDNLRTIGETIQRVLERRFSDK
ncbi:MAG: N-acetylmuramoyl-L-alanine amidase [Candidatus Poribacteria bacterium]